MSPIDTSHLNLPPDAAHISEDRACPNCSYNLIGLQVGGRCPECGQPIMGKYGSLRFAEDLTQAPTDYLKKLAMGAQLMVIGMVVVPFAPVGFMFQNPTAAIASLIIASSCWLVGVYIITGPRVFSRPVGFDPLKESAKLRMVNRTIQSSWLIGSVLSLQMAFGPNSIATRGILIFYLIGFSGFIPMAAQIGDLATWGQHTGLRDRIRTSAWGVSIGGGIIVVAAMTADYLAALGMLLSFFAFLVFAATVACVLVFVISIIQLASLCNWAVRNSRHQMNVDQRKADRLMSKQHAAALADPDEPRPIDHRQEVARKIIKAPIRLNPIQEEANPYDLGPAKPSSPTNPTNPTNPSV